LEQRFNCSRLTENASNFGELSPADDGAHLPVFDGIVLVVLGGCRRVGGVDGCGARTHSGGGGGGRRRQADGAHVVAEVDRTLQLEQRQVVDEAGVQVARVLDDPGDSAQLLEGRRQVSAAPQSAQTRYPVCVQIAATKMGDLPFSKKILSKHLKQLDERNAFYLSD